MLYKFKSQAAADVIMLKASAEELLKIIGKPAIPTGIVTVDQAPAAIAALKAEIERREAQGQGHAAPTSDDEARLKAFTSQISIGLENAKLFDDVQTIKNYNESILESMTNGVITLGEDGQIVTCNAAGVEGTHGHLGAGLSYGLGGNHAHRLAGLHTRVLVVGADHADNLIHLLFAGGGPFQPGLHGLLNAIRKVQPFQPLCDLLFRETHANSSGPFWSTLLMIRFTFSPLA